MWLTIHNSECGVIVEAAANKRGCRAPGVRQALRNTGCRVATEVAANKRGCRVPGLRHELRNTGCRVAIEVAVRKRAGCEARTLHHQASDGFRGCSRLCALLLSGFRSTCGQTPLAFPPTAAWESAIARPAAVTVRQKDGSVRQEEATLR